MEGGGQKGGKKFQMVGKRAKQAQYLTGGVQVQGQRPGRGSGAGVEIRISDMGAILT